jgi:hypothetical protein
MDATNHISLLLILNLEHLLDLQDLLSGQHHMNIEIQFPLLLGVEVPAISFNPEVPRAFLAVNARSEVSMRYQELLGFHQCVWWQLLSTARNLLSGEMQSRLA